MKNIAYIDAIERANSTGLRICFLIADLEGATFTETLARVEFLHFCL